MKNRTCLKVIVFLCVALFINHSYGEQNPNKLSSNNNVTALTASVLLIPISKLAEKHCTKYKSTQPLRGDSSGKDVINQANSICSASVLSGMSFEGCATFGQCFTGIVVNFPPGTINTEAVENQADQQEKEFKDVAIKKIQCPNNQILNSNEINKKITGAYAELYKQDKNLKWAGMASYASDLVGLGIKVGDVIS